MAVVNKMQECATCLKTAPELEQYSLSKSH